MRRSHSLRRCYGRAGFLPGVRKRTDRLSIDGWRIHYFEPTYGERSFSVDSHKALADAKAWLDAGGYSYTVSERR